MSARKISVFSALAALLMLGVAAGAQTPAPYPTQKVGNYAVELRVPEEGLFAEEETDVEFRVTDTSKDDPVQGAPPVVKAKVAARVTMPAMPAMPTQEPKTHSEGVPGDYGVVLYFPHGGEYQIDLTITPPDDKAFTAAFKVPVKDASEGKNRKPKPKPYTLEVRSNPTTPRAGEPAELSLVIRSRETKQPVTEFETVHEQKLHFIIVTKDLSLFAHEHPTLGADGTFTLRYTFPVGGDYRLFADVAPRGAGSQVLMEPFKVAGAPPAETGTLQPVTLMKPAGGVKIAMLTDSGKLPVGRMMPLTFAVRDAKSNEPITDLQPWLGAMAHLILIHEDATTFVHSHPDESDPTNGHNGTLTFLARFPKPGLYKGWIQFQRKGEVQTVPFVVAAKARGE
jgi:hypothetical protein